MFLQIETVINKSLSMLKFFITQNDYEVLKINIDSLLLYFQKLQKRKG